MLNVIVDLPKEKKILKVKKQESSQIDEAASCETRHGFAKKKIEKKKKNLKKLLNSYSSIPQNSVICWKRWLIFKFFLKLEHLR